MSIEIKVPHLGESITTGYLTTWHVSDGDTVKADQILYELETDKITSEGIAEADGVISISVAEGEEVEIGQVLGHIDTEVKSQPDQQEEDPAPVKEDPAEKSAASPGKPSPAVRRLAEEEGIDPDKISGTGKGSRVTKADVLKTLEQKKSEPAETVSKTSEKEAVQVAPSAPVASRTARETRTPVSPLRKRIAERLVEAQQNAALLTTFNECDLSAVMAMRKKYQEAFQKKHEVKLGFMSFFVKAVVYALQAVPKINARIDGNEIVQNHYYDIGVAVGTKRGLLVPVIRDCDSAGFAGIEKQILEYANKARSGKIAIEDLQGGVFTITNGGIYGSMLSTPIVNSPQSGILGMHAIKERPVAVDGNVEIRPMMYLALTYDHRLVDGSEAVTFLVKVKEAIEEPERLLLEL